jgi:hypothetical protein
MCSMDSMRLASDANARYYPTVMRNTVWLAFLC